MHVLTLDDRELASVLAGLGLLRGMRDDENGDDIEDDLLENDDLDALIERIEAGPLDVKPPEKPRLAIVLEGGLVSNIVSDGDLVGLPVAIVDYDIEGATEDEVDEIDFTDGSTDQAVISMTAVEQALIAMPALYEQLK